MNSRCISRAEFSQLRSTRTRAQSGPIRITFIETPESHEVKIAFAISRRVGCAVKRNKIRRRIREIIRTRRSNFLSGVYLVTVFPKATELTFRELEPNVLKVMENVQKVGRI